MKKVLIFCLILLCTLSVFAADVSAKVKVYLSYGSDGFSFSSNKGTWEPVIALALNGDYAGAEFKWCPIINNNSSNLFFKTWVKPFGFESFFYNEKLQDTKLEVGSYISADSSFIAYGVVDFKAIEFSDNTIYTGLGFGYKPNSINDFTNADVFVSSYFNYVNTEIGTFHIDNLTKLNVEANKPSLNYSLTETTYGLALEDWTPFYNKGAIKGSFDFDESYYFTIWGNSWVKHESIVDVTPSFGLRYKYYTEADMQNETGLYGIAIAGNTDVNGIGLEGEFEIGRNGSEFIGKIKGSKESFNYQALVGFDTDWSNDFKVRPEVYSKISYKDDKGNTFYLNSNYNNSYNSPADGIFFNPGVTFNVGSCGLDIGATVGFDSQKNFKWSAQSQSSFLVSF